MKSFEKIGILGTGNVAWHLCKALLNANLTISGVIGRNTESLKTFENDFNVNTSTQLEDLNNSDLLLCAISDGALINYLENLKTTTPIAYTSGSIQLDSFSTEKIGVFYPLQTFTKGAELDITKVPFFIESKDERFTAELQKLASKISDKVYLANSEKRSEIHLAAVFANNFTNHMFHIAESYLKQKELDFNLLLPLIEESVRKLNKQTPKEIQTGPAKRKDKNVIDSHLEKLEGSEKEIYALITKAIQEKDEKL
ncbi:MAG: Rossmann-like and DUF2520 domain-containing protein [Lishizhenia sp.]